MRTRRQTARPTDRVNIRSLQKSVPAEERKGERGGRIHTYTRMQHAARNMDLSSDDMRYELFMSHLQKLFRLARLASLRSND